MLGGSSPFTVALVDALADATAAIAPVVPMHLLLAGRNADHLGYVAAYAKARLGGIGWSCNMSTDAACALDGADIVIHQIRYGDLALRSAGERLCHAFGVAADETLGPAALLTAVLSRGAIERTVTLIRHHCPQAWVLNLTNPLSLVTATMGRELPRCVGLCELPTATLRQAAAALNFDAATLEWDYRGLNHRGFIVRLTRNDENLMPQLVDRLSSNADGARSPATIGGITSAYIAELGALPLKYFALMHQRTCATPGRADFVADLRMQIVQQLRADATRSPPAARQRDQAWYPLAVVPMLKAIGSPRPSVQVVNRLCDDDLVWELKAPVSCAGIGAPLPAARPGPAVADWLERFRRHEQAAAQAMAAPTRQHLRRALEADPALPEADVAALLDVMLTKISDHERSDHAYA